MRPPALNDNDGTDLKAWLCTVPGIPLWWGKSDQMASAINAAPFFYTDWQLGLQQVCESHIFSLPQSVAPVPQHIGEVPIGDDLPAKS